MFSKVINIRNETESNWVVGNIYVVELFSGQTAGPNWHKFVKEPMNTQGAGGIIG